MFANLTAGLNSFGFGAAAFPYTLEAQPYPHAWGGWAHYKATAHEDKSLVSVFKLCTATAEDARMVAARNGVKRLKMLRHPNILAFRHSHETTEKGQAVMYVVTQAVQPLQSVLEELDLQGEQRYGASLWWRMHAA